VIDVVKMVKMSRDMKRRVSTVVWIAKTAFHWGFIPAVLYLGTVVSYSVQLSYQKTVAGGHAN